MSRGDKWWKSRGHSVCVGGVGVRLQGMGATVGEVTVWGVHRG